MSPVQTPFVNVIACGEMLPGPVLAARMASPKKSMIVLLCTSVARIVTSTGTPAICGDSMVPISKWSGAAAITWMGSVVIPMMVPAVVFVMVRVWAPTVPNERLT